MSISVEYLDNGVGVCWLGRGIVSGQDLLDASRETFRSEEKLKQIKYAIIDFMSADGESVQTEDVREKAELDSEAAAINPDIVVAVLASKDVIFGLSRMWEAFVDKISWETGAFRSRAEAEQWIRKSVKGVSGADLTLK